MSTMLRVLALTLLGGCPSAPVPAGDDDDDDDDEVSEPVADAPSTGDDDDDTDDTGAAAGPFEPRTWAYDRSGWLSLSVTDTDDLTACSLPNDIDNARPGGDAQQIAVVLATGYDSCPEGLYNLTCDRDYGDQLYPDCAELRDWTPNGSQHETTRATGGAVRISRAGAGCRFEVEIAFPGGVRYEDVFVIPTESDVGPWCLQE